MIGKLKVSPEDMRVAATELTQYVRDMEQCFTTVKQTMENTKNYWSGEGRDAHYKLYTDEQSKIEEFLARCREHITDLNAMAGVYDQAEQTAVSKAEELPVIQF